MIALYVASLLRGFQIWELGTLQVISHSISIDFLMAGDPYWLIAMMKAKRVGVYEVRTNIGFQLW